MNLPISIEPNPLISTAVELRFNSNLTSDQVLQTFYPKLIASLPNFTSNDIPGVLKEQPEFSSSADYTFANDKFSVSVGKSVVSFQNLNGYHFWKSYFSFIKDKLLELNSLNIVQEITRIGLRYISILDGTKNFEDALNINFSLPEQIGFRSTGKHHRVQFQKDNITIFIQLWEGAKATRLDKKLEGLYVDADVAIIDKLPQKIGDELFSNIDKIHSIEKEVFYSLLKPEFLKTLNPKY